MTQPTKSLAAIAGPTRIGRYEIHTIETGTFALDGGAMFGIVPKTIWDLTNPADELNRIDMHLRALLLIDRQDKRVILIDNGIGAKWPGKFLKIYKIDQVRWEVARELATKGLKPEDVTDIIATHLHFDHIGGTTALVERGGKMVVEPVFPNARFWVQRQNWDLAYSPNEKDRASYLKENFEHYEKDSKLCLVESAYGARDEILPGIFARVSNGHTPGLQMIEIADDQASLIYCADAVPTASHVRVPFIMGYDCFPLTMIEEKKKLLREAEERKMILFFEHCPRAEAATVAHDGRDFAVTQAFSF